MWSHHWEFLAVFEQDRRGAEEYSVSSLYCLSDVREYLGYEYALVESWQIYAGGIPSSTS